MDLDRTLAEEVGNQSGVGSGNAVGTQPWRRRISQSLATATDEVQKSTARKHSSFSPKHLSCTCDSWDDEWMDMVKDLGFGGILSIDPVHIDRSFSLWLLSRLDPRTMNFAFADGSSKKLEESDVCRILGLRQGGIPIPTFVHEVGREDLAKVKNILGMDPDVPGYISVASISKVLKQAAKRRLTEELKDLIRVAYTLLACAWVLAPTGRDAVLPAEVLTCVLEPQSIRDYNWAKYVLEILRVGAARLKEDLEARAKCYLLVGCLIVPQIFYLDCMDFGLLTFNRLGIPRVSHLKQSKMRLMIKRDMMENGPFKQYGRMKRRRNAADVDQVCGVQGGSTSLSDQMKQSEEAEGAGEVNIAVDENERNEEDEVQEIVDCSPSGGSNRAKYRSLSAFQKGWDRTGEKSEIRDVRTEANNCSPFAGVTECQSMDALAAAALVFQLGVHSEVEGLTGGADGSIEKVPRIGENYVPESAEGVDIRGFRKCTGRRRTITPGVQSGGSRKCVRRCEWGKANLFSSSAIDINSREHSSRGSIRFDRTPIVLGGGKESFSDVVTTPIVNRVIEKSMEGCASGSMMARSVIPKEDVKPELGRYVWGVSPFDINLWHEAPNKKLVQRNYDETINASNVVLNRRWFDHRFPYTLCLTGRELREQFGPEGELMQSGMTSIIRALNKGENKIYKKAGMERYRCWLDPQWAVDMLSFEEGKMEHVRHDFEESETGYDVRKCRLIMAPIYVNYGWCLYVFDIQEKKLSILDPRLTTKYYTMFEDTHLQRGIKLIDALGKCYEEFFDGWQINERRWELDFMFATHPRCSREESGWYVVHYLRSWDGFELKVKFTKAVQEQLRKDLLYQVMYLRYNSGVLPSFQLIDMEE